MGRVYRIIFRRNTPNRGVLFAEGAFVRKNYEASGCLYLPEEMKDVLTEEELAKIFQKRAAECRNFTVIRYPGYTSTPILFAGGMGVHIPYRVDNRELGFLHVPEEMMKILTAEELTKNVKAIVNQEKNFLRYRGDGSPCSPKTKLTDAGLDNLVINNEEVDEKNNVEKESAEEASRRDCRGPGQGQRRLGREDGRPAAGRGAE